MMNATSSLFGEPTGSDPRGQYRQTVDVDQARRAREQTSVQIRKTKKEENLNRRRRVIDDSSNQISGQNAADASLYASQLPRMVEGLMSNDPATQKEYATMFRRLLSVEKNPPIDKVIAAGVVPRLVQLLQSDGHPALQFEAAWALTNVASGTSDNTRTVIAAGAVPVFVRLLASGSREVKEQVTWALGNVAGDSFECRNMVLQAGALPALLSQLNADANVSMLRNATWTISNLCRGKPPPDFNQVRMALPALATLVNMSDAEVLTDSVWALSYLSDGPNEKIEAVINAGVVPRCVELLGHELDSVQTPALRTVGNFVTGDDKQTEEVLKTDVLRRLLPLLDSKKKGIRKEACWALSNITAGNFAQIQSVIEANIFPKLIQMLSTEQFEIQKEAAWAVSNATAGGTIEQILYLVENGCIKPLCDLLSVADTKIILVALEAIENVLRAGFKHSEESPESGGDFSIARFVEEAGGLEKIEALQTHQDKVIYQKASNILMTYYDTEADEVNVAPDTTNANQFNFQQTGRHQMNFGSGF